MPLEPAITTSIPTYHRLEPPSVKSMFASDLVETLLGALQFSDIDRLRDASLRALTEADHSRKAVQPRIKLTKEPSQFHTHQELKIFTSTPEPLTQKTVQFDTSHLSLNVSALSVDQNELSDLEQLKKSVEQISQTTLGLTADLQEVISQAPRRAVAPPSAPLAQA